MKTKRPKCSKCKTPLEDGAFRLQNHTPYYFCLFCNILLDKYPDPEHIQMLLDDTLPLNQIDKDILNARVNRAKGKSPWRKKDGPRE